MALLNLHFFSKTLHMMSEVDVIIPERQAKSDDEEISVLWLLHGGYGTHSDWHRHTNIERYVEGKNMAVVMPCAGNSRYCNMEYGADYYDYLVKELPGIIKHYLPQISEKREKNFIAGLSLGGSGAISLGMRNPDKYGAIGVLSASSIIPLEYLRAPGPGPESPGGPGKMGVNMINFGVEDTNELEGTRHDVLMHARNNYSEGKPLPRVFHAVGQQDHAYPVGQGLKKFFEEFDGNPFDYEYHEEPGSHNWDFWDKWIRVFVDWLQDEKEGA